MTGPSTSRKFRFPRQGCVPSWRATLLASATWLIIDTSAGYAQTYIINYQVISSPSQFPAPIYLQGGQLSAAASLPSISGAINVDDGQTGTLSAQTGGAVTVDLGRLGQNAVLHLGSTSEQGTIVVNSVFGTAVSHPPVLYIDGGYIRAGSWQFASVLGTLASTTVAANATLDFDTNAASIRNLQGGGTVGSLDTRITVNGGNYSGSIVGASQLEFRGNTTWSGTGSNIQAYQVDSGATLTTSGGATMLATASLTVDGTYNLNSSETVGSLSGAGNVVIASGQTLAAGSDNTSTTFSGVISGPGGLTKNGTGALTLSGTNTYGGDTIVNAGALVMGTSNAVPGTRTLIVWGGTYDLNNFDQSVGGINGNPGSTVALGSATLTVGGANQNTGYFGNITGSGGLVKTGTSYQDLYGTNSYSGSTVVEGGVLRVTSNGTLLNTPAIDVYNSSAFTVGTVNALSSAVGITLHDAGSGLILNANQTIGSLAGGGGSYAQLNSGGLLTTGTSNGNSLFAGHLDGDGALTKVGTGALTLSGFNTYTGATTVSAGSLYVNGSIATSSGVTVAAGALLGGSGTVSSTVVNGTLSAGNSPGTLSVAGNLALNPGATSVFELNTPGVVGGSNPGSGNDLVTVSNNLTLGGTLDARVAAAGFYRLFSYGGALSGDFAAKILTSTTPGFTIANAQVETTIPGQVNLSVLGSGQNLQFWDGADAIGNGTVDGGVGTWSAAGTNWTGQPGRAAINGPWSGSVGVFAGAAGGVVTVVGTQRFDTLQFSTNGYTLSGGTLAIAPASGNAGVFNVDSNISAAIASTIADGSGTVLSKAGGGTLVLTGNNSYSGGTILSGGTLSVSSDSNLGLAGGGLTFTGGTLQVAGTSFTATSREITLAAGGGGFDIADAANTFTVNQAISGTGALTKSGAGMLVLAGANSYQGGTTIRGGVLQVSADNNLGAGGSGINFDGGTLSTQSSFKAARNLAFAGAGTINTADGTEVGFDGAIGGSGPFTKSGGGRLTFGGDGSSFSGATMVSAGTLAVNGVLGGTLAVDSGARLQGSGTVGPVTLAASATIAPGNSIGTLNVAGNLAFAPGAIYEAQVDAGGQGDRIVASGLASLSGAKVNVLAGSGNYGPRTSYTILTAAGGLSGTFADVSSNFAFLTPSLTYDPHSVTLTLTRNSTDFAAVGTTPNQRTTGAAIDRLVGTGGPLWSAVLQMDEGTARRAFDQLSGEIHASNRAVLLQDSHIVRDAMMDRLRDAFATAGAPSLPIMAYAAADSRQPAITPNDDVVVWGQALGAWGYLAGDGNASRISRTTSGVLAGADARISGSDWRLGFVGGYSQTRLDVTRLGASGTSDNAHVGLYAGTEWNALALRAGVASSWQDLAASRTIVLPNFADRLSSSYGTWTTQVFGELGYRLRAGRFDLEPFAGAAYVNVASNAFRENGGAAALTGYNPATEATITTLGAHAATGFDLAGVFTTARATAGWRHAFGAVTPLTMVSFESGAAFPIAGTPLARDTAVIEAGLDARVSAEATINLSYSSQLSGALIDQSFRTGLILKF
ncbi:autotransporter domain-containing protein [Bradyrhizobium acaciae]|uniref:autotransporter domain-containing protein n=1 Tax=Bradyrhizobium acaciae TaxID=2683706 RepID=UPI001E423E88|nr:autotransporter domain-containing protein [Bradyrhizobium acaciae]MCC8978222.1 autotransporter domain-containing protein [Bradyrhizobium acaciae]